MARTNGKPETQPQELDLEHELPAADGDVGEAGAPENEPRSTAAASELEALQQENRKLRAEREALLDRAARQQAEFENARKRAAREQQDYRDYALAEAIKSLLPVLDSLERALTTRPEGESLREGVELIYRQLLDTLGRLGLQPIATEGQRFDPRVHEAIEVVATTEAEDNQILEELQRGYKLKDRLLRPAMVRVAHKPHK
jgi:molecular chaperone GrpE